MRLLHVVLVAAAVAAAPALAQTPAPAPAKAAAPAAGTVKAVQPGLLEVAGPRVNEVMAAGIEKITAVTDKGSRSIYVESQWGNSYYGWPKNVKPVAFTVEVGKPAGSATINAPGYTEANKADYKAAIESVLPNAIRFTNLHKSVMQDTGK